MAKLGFVLGLLLISGSAIAPASPVVASPDVAKWSPVNIPAEGRAGNWVLVSGSDVQHLTLAIDGTLYAYANLSGTDFLFKSTDGGYTWSQIKVTERIVALATAPDSAVTLYYATTSRVYKSTDGGNSFILLPPNPGGAGSNNVEITSLAVTYAGNYIIAVGTRDTDSGQYGGIYILDEGQPVSGWQDTNLGNYDVYTVIFSPHFRTDRQLVAVATDETNTIITTRLGNGGWGKTINDARIPSVAVDTSAAIAFPSDYEVMSNYVLFVAIDAGTETGDVYRVNGEPAPGTAEATDLNIGSVYGLNNVDVTSLVVTGNATTARLLAGVAGSAQVYFSPDGGKNWTRSTKPPTGQSRTYVMMPPQSQGRAYAATSGTESAVSYTTNGGATWNQIALIDTQISTLLDLALSPSYRQDSTLLLLTYGGEHSLWRSLDDGVRWERVFSGALPTVDAIDKVRFSPTSNQVVFLAGSSNGNPVIWKSTDNGQSFSPPRTARDPTGATFSIDTWAVVDDNTLFVGSYDGTNGLVYRTTNSGLFYTNQATAGTRSLHSIALSPGYHQDETILVGNTYGEVYWSNDNGASFELLARQLPELITGGSDSNNATVAFDPGYSHNSTVYTASHCKKGLNNSSAIYRFIIGTSTSWKSIDSTIPSSAIIDRLVVSADGTLYATNSKAKGGMERSLNPTYPLGSTFETVTHGLDDSATLAGLWLEQNQLWSIDTTNKRLMTYTDSLTLPVTPTSPADKAPGIGTTNVSLDWKALSGATKYQWQLDYDTDFSSVPAGFEGETSASSARLSTLQPATTYYWRVRATEPVLSPWSAKWSFTTSLGAVVIAPVLYSPEAGARGVPLRPIFQWSAISGAASYELVVAADVSFANPVIVRVGDYALTAEAWQSDINLNYATTYYWKVRARSPESYGAWSALGAFTTESPPKPQPPQPALPEPAPPEPTRKLLSDSAPPPSLPLPSPPLSVPPPPSPLPSEPATPEWAKWLMNMGVALLLTMLAILIALIVLTVKIRRL